MTIGKSPVQLSYFSDILCVWAYVAQVRLDELHRQFGDQVRVQHRFCSVFGDVQTKIVTGWREKGGVAAYRDHVVEVVGKFDHIRLHADTWARTIPTTSSTPHAFIKAAELHSAREGATDTAVALSRRFREAFFAHGLDISRLSVQLAIAAELGLAERDIRTLLEDGSAWAALQGDYATALADGVRGSPTYLLNERRQTLYGNVGYRVLEANVQELLREPGDYASWC